MKKVFEIYQLGLSVFKHKIVVFLCFFLLHHSSSAQKSEITGGLHAPLYYTPGFEYHLTPWFSVNAQVGVLTKPFDQAIVEIAKAFGANREIVNLIGQSYRIGWNFQPTLKFHFGKNYFGLYYSQLRLYADAEPDKVLETFYSYNVPSWMRSTLNFLTVNSNLHNAGLLYGRRITFQNPAFELRFEASFAKNLESNSQLRYRGGQEVPFLSGFVDQELRQYYLDYGYLPSINMMFVYKFGAQP